MVFESIEKGLGNIEKYPTNKDVEKHIFVSGVRANQLVIVKEVFQAKCLKKIFHNDIFNMAIEYFISSLDKMSEEEAIELLEELYKETRLWIKGVIDYDN